MPLGWLTGGSTVARGATGPSARDSGPSRTRRASPVSSVDDLGPTPQIHLDLEEDEAAPVTCTMVARHDAAQGGSLVRTGGGGTAHRHDRDGEAAGQPSCAADLVCRGGHDQVAGPGDSTTLLNCCVHGDHHHCDDQWDAGPGNSATLPHR